MEQNTIALIWDFDRTLIDGYMQAPLFKKFGVDSARFWREVAALHGQYKKQGITVNKETIYLDHVITCAHQGIFPNLNNDMLFSFGAELTFYNGIPQLFEALQTAVSSCENYRKFGIEVEHYIVSTGFSATIRGSKIAKYVKGIWGCEFIETPIASSLGTSTANAQVGTEKIVSRVGYALDNTTKTRAIFEINKGANMFDSIDVNSKMDAADRRVPFTNMIYIADGPSDVPVFSLLNQYGGKTFAVYPKGDDDAFSQADLLLRDGRVQMFAEADYSENTMAYKWLMKHTLEIAQSIYETYDEQIKQSAKKPPQHLS